MDSGVFEALNKCEVDGMNKCKRREAPHYSVRRGARHRIQRDKVRNATTNVARWLAPTQGSARGAGKSTARPGGVMCRVDNIVKDVKCKPSDAQRIKRALSAEITEQGPQAKIYGSNETSINDTKSTREKVWPLQDGPVHRKMN
ncbi:hypothetical protein HAX54_032963 [Datura stramonium]|uniref:Uncharacterized protein n=1 Tax=Datura stramonium TaxID=4076 RepID=A0ABS8VBH5_DATST|nr:hypothetical protein [Datura stramonium]